MNLKMVISDKESAISIEEYRANAEHQIETEIKITFEEEIRNATRDLLE
jgi:hypothetical protein